MAKDKVTSNSEKNQEAVELGKRIKQEAIESGLLPKTTMQGRVESVQGDMCRVADSLDFIKKMIYEANYSCSIDDLVPPMLEERVAHIRERARELYLDLGVEQPGE